MLSPRVGPLAAQIGKVVVDHEVHSSQENAWRRAAVRVFTRYSP
jgi:hypothetical protein